MKLRYTFRSLFIFNLFLFFTVYTVTDHGTNKSSSLGDKLHANPTKNKFKKTKTNRSSEKLNHYIRGLFINLHS